MARLQTRSSSTLFVASAFIYISSSLPRSFSLSTSIHRIDVYMNYVDNDRLQIRLAHRIGERTAMRKAHSHATRHKNPHTHTHARTHILFQ